MTKSTLHTLAAIAIGIASMVTISSCTDDDLANGGGGNSPFNPNIDQMTVKVTADIPTAVLSSFDDNSMGAALQRRLSKTSSSIQADTKMILIKGEDIKSRPITEWFEMAKIYLKGGYIAVEKPHDAHMVQVMEQLSAKFEQATNEILTEDDGSGITVNIIPPNTPSSNSLNAEAERFKVRLANIEALASRSSTSENQPVAEMVIFSCMGYYQCAPYGKNVVTIGTNGNSGASQTIITPYSNRNSGLLADGAAKWINTKSDELAVTKSNIISKADGGGAINEIMSASEEETYQAFLTSMSFDDPNDKSKMDFRSKPGAYTEIYRIWGVNNTETHRDYYFVEQNVTVGMGGKKDGDDRFDRNKTLYHGPYKENEWINASHKFKNESNEEHEYDNFYGSWFDYGEYKLDISGNGNIMLQNALPETDNNTTSVSIAVGETHSETNTIGGSVGGMLGKNSAVTFSVNYSHGWTNGTSYTMTTTTNSKELKCVKNTSGTQVQWYYSCGTDMVAGDGDKHPLAPDALTNDVNIKNQVCWSVDNPKGAYTVNANHVRTTGWLSNRGGGDKTKGTCRAEGQPYQFTMLVPNRAKQTWYMDVTFPEIDDPKYAGVKTQLTDALAKQFPDIYQTSMELADLTVDSENTIKVVVNDSRKMFMNPNAMQTLREYGRTYQLSEYTIKWYNTLVDDNGDPIHGTYVMNVQVK